MGENISLGFGQARTILRGLKEYLTVLNERRKDLEKEAKKGVIGAASEYARVTAEIMDVERIIKRLEVTLNERKSDL